MVGLGRLQVLDVRVLGRLVGEAEPAASRTAAAEPVAGSRDASAPATGPSGMTSTIAGAPTNRSRYRDERPASGRGYAAQQRGLTPPGGFEGRRPDRASAARIETL